MSTRTFIDTNILVYADAFDEPVKQSVALSKLKTLFESRTGVISTQVLKEYCNVAIKKLKLSPQRIRARLDLYEQFDVVQVTPAIIRLGIDLNQMRSIAFYDAIILASAQTAGCNILLSEDMAAGEQIGGVKIINPFPSNPSH